ncbi:hypothetical protein Acy02nite_33120 [Actinoplanes cyaneus]|uniref:Trypsin-co-occurring domain-containing protein n=1 Tax=Actinoplanes cyaneus TaxID=52696 RepID=A0A919IHW1_9ACTN|nr:CU044_2847 family protein [Actinoplanes cyaneus]MCW2140117.1 hypothetical protein [Actinoplanes cyaneus]GID65431.1 hypothetical protein Acy02nite_33120 [Actinoplanes cyaneus]
MPDPVSVRLPSGQVIQVAVNESEHLRPSGPRDVGLGDAAIQIMQLPDFVGTVDGVLDMVKLAVSRSRPDTVSVEFGIEISVKAGKLVSVVADAGGKCQLKLTATWGKAAAAPAGPAAADDADQETPDQETDGRPG